MSFTSVQTGHIVRPNQTSKETISSSTRLEAPQDDRGPVSFRHANLHASVIGYEIVSETVTNTSTTGANSTKNPIPSIYVRYLICVTAHYPSNVVTGRLDADGSLTFNSSGPDGMLAQAKWITHRRFREFATLHDAQSQHYSMIPSFPSKQSTSRVAAVSTDPLFLESRQKMLNAYLQGIMRIPAFVQSDDIDSFLQISAHIPLDPKSCPSRCFQFKGGAFGLTDFIWLHEHSKLISAAEDLAMTTRLEAYGSFSIFGRGTSHCGSLSITDISTNMTFDNVSTSSPSSSQPHNHQISSHLAVTNQTDVFSDVAIEQMNNRLVAAVPQNPTMIPSPVPTSSSLNNNNNQQQQSSLTSQASSSIHYFISRASALALETDMQQHALSHIYTGLDSGSVIMYRMTANGTLLEFVKELHIHQKRISKLLFIHFPVGTISTNEQNNVMTTSNNNNNNSGNDGIIINNSNDMPLYTPLLLIASRDGSVSVVSDDLETKYATISDCGEIADAVWNTTHQHLYLTTFSGAILIYHFYFKARSGVISFHLIHGVHPYSDTIRRCVHFPNLPSPIVLQSLAAAATTTTSRFSSSTSTSTLSNEIIATTNYATGLIDIWDLQHAPRHRVYQSDSYPELLYQIATIKSHAKSILVLPLHLPTSSNRTRMCNYPFEQYGPTPFYYIFSGHSNGALVMVITNLLTRQYSLVQVINAHVNDITQITYCPQRDIILTASRDRSLAGWKIPFPSQWIDQIL